MRFSAFVSGGQIGLATKGTEMRRTAHAVLCGLWLLAADNVGHAQVGTDNFMVTTRDFVMTQEDALKFSDQVVSPIVFAFAENKSALQAIRMRLQRMLDMVHRKEISYIPLPAYYPIRSLHVVAKLELIDSQPAVIMFIPEIRDWQLKQSEEQFKYGLVTTLAHEMIHFELGHHQHTEGSIQDAARDEGEAWAKTIIEIIRPLQANGSPVVPYFADLASCFHRLNDDSSNPIWTKVFIVRDCH